jgi:predicted ATPase/DNA-binding winged helix-turn-helix (wHTH) protein
VDAERDPLAAVEFGRFKVVPHRRELTVDGVPIALGSRAFDALIVLIDAGGTVVSKDELMRRVWPDRVVEENNLQFQISTLRKAFGADRDLIRTLAGRGYQFTGEIRSLARRPPPILASTLPEPVSELIGREKSVHEIITVLTSRRLLTLIGTGGIGKSRLALEVARQLLPNFADGVGLVELGPLTDPQLVPGTVASALTLRLAGGTASVENVVAALAGRQVLVVLDNCEHLIEAAAQMAEALLRAGPGVCVVATSREPLRTVGESVYRVPSLDVPDQETVDVDEVLRYGAVELFVARAQAAEPRFVLDRRVAPAAVAICRRLDGLPLAIELAAARIAAFGVDGVASKLNDRFRLLTGGSRTVLPRQQTLRATLDWSHDLLAGPDRVLLRRLAVMAGSFSLQAAAAIATGPELADGDVVECMANLVAKSLIAVDLGGAGTSYRLLETTRAYASEKLAESGEGERCARRHAEYHRDLFERAHAEWQAQPTAEWLVTYGPALDDVRAALDWAFASGGDAALGVALTIAAVPLWVQRSLLGECCTRVERALSKLAATPGHDARAEMQLQAALGWSLMGSTGPEPGTDAAWMAALRLAESLADTDHQLRALYGLWCNHVYTGHPREGVRLAERFCAVATKAGNPADLLIGERLMGVALHFLGEQTPARGYTERMLERYESLPGGSDLVRFQFEQRAVARVTLSRILWLQGFADQALRTVKRGVDDALAVQHALSLCNVLAQAACPVASAIGDLAAGDRYTAMLAHHAAQQGAEVWQSYGRCYKGMLLIKRHEFDAGVPLLTAAVDELRRARYVQYDTAFLAALAEGFAGARPTGQDR